MALSGGLTSTGVVVGTTNYMPPEQWQGGRLDARVDVYSLGCVLFETLTGRVPYERDGQAARMYAHLTEPPPMVSSLAPGAAAFDDVIVRALAKDPADRYPSAGDLGYAAVAAAESRPVTRPERSIAVGDAAPKREDAAAELEATTAAEHTPTVVQPKTIAAEPGFNTPATRRQTSVTTTRRASERSATRSSNALALIILGIVALAGIAAAALAAGGAFSHSTSSTAVQTTAASQPQASTTRPASPTTTTVVKTVVVQQSAPPTTAPVTVPASASAQVTATGGWPAGTSAWTVVLKSASTQADAEQAASSASAAGVSETGVLLSADHRSLRPGYWVAFSGVLTHDEAGGRATAAHAAGFSDAYVRYVSAN